VICLSPVLRLVLSSAGVDIYATTFSRLDGLMAGALLAIVIRSTDFVPSRYLGKAWMALGIATPLTFFTEAVDARWIVFSMSAAASVSLIYLALCSGQPWLQGVLRNRFLVYTGTISYGLYLLHKIPFNVGTALHVNQHPLLAAPILLAIAYGMATLSWNLLERPFLNLKRFFVTEPSRLRNADLQFVGEGSRHVDNIGRST
jgi:peptidoglycan/LPS O-acetylase OafA/YrhL